MVHCILDLKLYVSGKLYIYAKLRVWSMFLTRHTSHTRLLVKSVFLVNDKVERQHSVSGNAFLVSSVFLANPFCVSGKGFW